MTLAQQAKIRRFATNPVVYATTLALLTLWLGFIFLKARSLTGPNDSVAHSLGLVGLGICVILILASVIYAKDKGRTRVLSYGVWASLAILAIGLILPYVIGGAGNLLHVRCVGFFGVQESCIEHLQLEFVFLTTLFPSLLISVPIVLAVLILLVLGIWKALRHHSA